MNVRWALARAKVTYTGGPSKRTRVGDVWVKPFHRMVDGELVPFPRFTLVYANRPMPTWWPESCLMDIELRTAIAEEHGCKKEDLDQVWEHLTCLSGDFITMTTGLHMAADGRKLDVTVPEMPFI